MTLKKISKTNNGQSALEYIALFIVFTASIIWIFGSLTPEKLNIKTAFDYTVRDALTEIAK